MRIKLNEITPVRVYDAALRRMMDIPDLLSWRHSSFSNLNRQHLNQYQSAHKGKRCFVMANGPSLAKMDLSALKDEFTMSMNRAYLLYDDWGFTPTYYICINELVLEQFANDISNLKMPRFVNFNRRKNFKNYQNDDTLMFMRVGFKLNDEFKGDITRTVSSGGTVTFACLQLAYFMGFEEVIIIGMDHNFVEKGRPNKTEVRKTVTDESHCHPDYFPKGIKWQLPDLYRSELAYAMARNAYEDDGRRIIDATVGGKCDVFEKKDFTRLLKNKL